MGVTVTMQSMIVWCIAYHVSLAAVVTYLFTRHFENKGIDEGVRFGFYVGLLLAVVHLGSYVWMPVTGALVVGWIVSSLFWGVLSGVILGWLYRA